MSNTHIVYLYPQGTYRTPLRSDTLWGMICWGIRAVYDEKTLKNFLETYQQEDASPELIISSTFPWLQYDQKEALAAAVSASYISQEKADEILGKSKHTQSDRVLFFPKPSFSIHPPKGMTEEKKARMRKDIKKTKLLQQSSFWKILKGEVDKDYLGKEVLYSKYHPILASEAVTHNTLSRFSWATVDKDGTGQLFHTEETHVGHRLDLSEAEQRIIRQQADLGPQTGLFFLVQGKDISKLKAALRYFEDTGLGADRNTGKGFFRFDIESFSLPKEEEFESNHPVNAYMNLSLFHPTSDEANILQGSASPFLSYELERRQGIVGMTLFDKNKEKEPLMMFKEGSLFPKEALLKEGAGCIKEVLTPNADNRMTHPVYHNGYAFLVPIHLHIQDTDA